MANEHILSIYDWKTGIGKNKKNGETYVGMKNNILMEIYLYK